MEYLVASPRQAEIDQQAYDLALEYLFALDVPGLTREVVQTYGRPFTAKISRPATLAQVYLHFLVSAQNANMKPRVIGGAIGGVDKLSVVLCDSDADDYGVFKAIIRVARHCGVSPYEVDKMFWLTGSGYFYNHTAIGKEGKINLDRQKFIDFARSKMNT